MVNDTADNTVEKETLPGAAPDNTTIPPVKSGTPDGGETLQEDGHMIPKHRLDEEVAKRRETEERLNQMQEKFEQNDKWRDEVSKAITGTSGDTRDPKVQKLMQEYNLPAEFIDGFTDIMQEKVMNRVDERIKPLRSSQAQVAFTAQIEQLKAKYPQMREWSKDEEQSFKKIAVEDKYLKLNLDEILQLKYPEVVKESATTYAAESSHGRTLGGRKDSKPVAQMTAEEFNQYLASQGAKKSLRK
jgi:hypothetical protein